MQYGPECIVQGAFDNVHRVTLWQQLAKLGASPATIQVVKNLYSHTVYNIHLDDFKFEGVQATRGVRQGCPMSPTLFLSYINELGTRLESSGLGYRLGNNRIPGLLFADDIVLISESPSELQDLLDISTSYGNDFGLTFSLEKSKILIAYETAALQYSWTLQNHPLDIVQQYDYLGITLNGSKQPYSLMFPKLALRCRRMVGLVGKVAFQSYSRYEVVRGLWKGVGVPTLTYASDVVSTNNPVEFI